RPKLPLPPLGAEVPRGVSVAHALIPPLASAAFLRNISATQKSLSSQSLVTYPAALAAAKSCGTLRTASITWDWGMSGPQPHHCWMSWQARSELRVMPELNRTALLLAQGGAGDRFMLVN